MGLFFFAKGAGSRGSNDPERAGLLAPVPDQIKMTMMEAEKHRDSHRRQGMSGCHPVKAPKILTRVLLLLAKILEWTLQTLVILQIINGAIISAISATTWGSGVPTVVLGALASILGGVIAAFKSSKTQQREQLTYFALDTFVRKWHDWAYDFERRTNIHWDGRRDDLNESNFNAAYDQIQRYEVDSDRNLINFAYAVCANAPEGMSPSLPIGIGGIATSPLVLTPPRKAPVVLPVAH